MTFFWQDPNAVLSASNVEGIYKVCIKNFEECVTRFPEHYKSIYRLVLIYLNGPENIRELKKCKQLLLGTYTTALGNPIQGLFSDRKNNNLFNVNSVFVSRIFRDLTNECDFLGHLAKSIIRD